MPASIIQYPASIHPAYNPAEFILNASGAVLPNYRFYIEILDAASNPITNPLRLPKEPNSTRARFNASPFIKTFIDNLFTNGTNGAVESYLKVYTISVGEEYTYSWNYQDYQFNSNVGSQWNGYTKLVSSTAHTFVVGDQINVSQSDGGALKPMLTGLFTVVEIVNAFQIVINITFGAVGSGAAVGGTITYSDGRKILIKNQASRTHTAYNGVYNSNDFRNNLAIDFTTIPRRFGTNLKSGFRVMPNFDIWLTAYLWNIINLSYLQVASDSGHLVCDAIKDGEAMQFYAGSNTGYYDDVSGTIYNGKSVKIEFGNQSATLSEIIELPYWNGCPVDLVELLYCDRFGSYLPFYFRLVSEQTTESKRELLTDRYGEDLTIGATQQRSWLLRTDNLNSVELELFEILLTSPDVRMKINGKYERVINTTTSTTTARNKMKKRKELQVRLAMRDEVNA